MVDAVIDVGDDDGAPSLDLALDVVHATRCDGSPADPLGPRAPIVEVDRDLVAPLDTLATRHMGDDSRPAFDEQHSDLLGEVDLEVCHSGRVSASVHHGPPGRDRVARCLPGRSHPRASWDPSVVATWLALGCGQTGRIG
jgi:hypothetical protein